jgi:septum site-determining protein MinD
VLPFSDDMMALASGGIFALRYPDHPLTATFKHIAARLVA